MQTFAGCRKTSELHQIIRWCSLPLYNHQLSSEYSLFYGNNFITIEWKDQFVRMNQFHFLV